MARQDEVGPRLSKHLYSRECSNAEPGRAFWMPGVSGYGLNSARYPLTQSALWLKWGRCNLEAFLSLGR